MDFSYQQLVSGIKEISLVNTIMKDIKTNKMINYCKKQIKENILKNIKDIENIDDLIEDIIINYDFYLNGFSRTKKEEEYKNYINYEKYKIFLHKYFILDYHNDDYKEVHDMWKQIQLYLKIVSSYYG
jgi:hypothetical protein